MTPLKKITWILVTSSLLALALLISYLTHSLQDSAVRQWVDYKAISATQIASWIDGELEQAQDRLRFAANLAAFRLSPDATLINRQLNGIPQGVDGERRQALDWLLGESDHGFSVLFVLLPNGDHYLSHPFSVQQSLKTYNLSHRPYFREAAKTHKPVISDTFIGADGIAAVAIDVPILNQRGEIDSHLGGVFHLSGMKRLFDKPGFSGDHETTFLLDRSGKLITQNGGVVEQTNRLLTAPVVRDFLIRQLPPSADGDFHIVTELMPAANGNGKRIIMLLRLSSGWTLGVSTELEAVVAQFTPGIWRTAALSAALLMLIGGIGIFLASRIGLRWQMAEREVQLSRDHLELRVIERTAELSQKEEDLRTTLNSIGDAVVATNTESIITSMNPVAENLTGWKEDEALGEPLSKVFKIVNARTGEWVASPVKKALEKEEMVDLASDTKLIARDGTEYHIADSAAPIKDRSGLITGVVLVFRDVTKDYAIRTALQGSETRFRNLFENAGISIWNEDISDVCKALDKLRLEGVIHLRRYLKDNQQVAWDLAAMVKVLNVNEATLKLFGAKAEDELIYQIDKTFGSNAIEIFIDELCAIWSKEEVFRSEAAFRTLDGNDIDGIISFRIPEIAESCNSVPVSILDITDRKQAEREKERLQRELQQTHKMEALGQLTGGIAHDFNNILGIIMGYTSMALDRFGREIPEKAVDYLETAMKASERAKDLVAQMLTFSRSGNGDAQPLQFSPLIKENVKMLYSILPSSIKIELNCEEELPNILMDPAKLQQLMMNLCINARDAMDGVGTLTIALGWRRNVDTECSASHQWVKGDWVELSVADTGSGMTSETIKHLFEPFYTTKEVGRGTGMGMAVLHGIVSSHGGHTLIETEIGKGSVVRLLFPPAVEETSEKPEADLSSNPLPQGEGRHILVLDDELELAEYIGDLLALYGFQTTIKTDSQDALSLFQEDPDKFALLITDQTMPKLTGVELIKKFREIQPEFPVILCTGFSEDIDAEGAENMGICFLGKPIDADRLVQSAGELLGLKVG